MGISSNCQEIIGCSTRYFTNSTNYSWCCHEHWFMRPSAINGLSRQREVPEMGLCSWKTSRNIIANQTIICIFSCLHESYIEFLSMALKNETKLTFSLSSIILFLWPFIACYSKLPLTFRGNIRMYTIH